MPQGRPDFPLNAQTPSGYIIGSGRVVKVSTQNGTKFQKSKRLPNLPSKDKTVAKSEKVVASHSRGKAFSTNLFDTMSQPSMTKDTRETSITVKGAFSIKDSSKETSIPQIIDDLGELRSQKSAEPENAHSAIARQIHSICTEATISEKDWESIPEVVPTLKRKKMMHSGTVNLGSSEVHRPELIVYRPKNDSSVSENKRQGISQTLSPFQQSKFDHLLKNVDKVRQELGIVDVSLDASAAEKIVQLESHHLEDEETLQQTIKHCQLMLQIDASNEKYWVDLACALKKSGDNIASRKLLKEGCGKLPESEMVWMAYVESVPKTKQLSCIKDALVALPTSALLWNIYADSASSSLEKQEILFQALEKISHEGLLWKSLVDTMKSANDKCLTLRKAVECATDIDLWILLIQHEELDNVAEVLQRALTKFPAHLELFLAATDRQPNLDYVRRILSSAFTRLRETYHTRQWWYEHASKLEEDGRFIECKVVINLSMKLQLNLSHKRDTKHAWISDVGEFLSKRKSYCAKFLLESAVEVMPHSKGLWRRLAEVEQLIGGKSIPVLVRALKHHRDSAKMWLALAKSHIKVLEYSEAENVLREGTQLHPNCEELWILLFLAQEKAYGSDVVQRTYDDACKVCPTPRLQTKRMVFLRRIRGLHHSTLIPLLEELLSGAADNRKCWKLWAILLSEYLAQVSDSTLTQARHAADRALRLCGTSSAVLWNCAAALEEASGHISRGRAILDTSRQTLRRDVQVWRFSVRYELRNQNPTFARKLSDLAVTVFRGDKRFLGQIYAIQTEALSISARLSHLRYVLTQFPEEPLLLLQQVLVHYRMGDTGESLMHCSALNELHPDYADAWALRSAIEGKGFSYPEFSREQLYGEYWEKLAREPDVAGPCGCILPVSQAFQRVQETLLNYMVE